MVEISPLVSWVESPANMKHTKHTYPRLADEYIMAVPTVVLKKGDRETYIIYLNSMVQAHIHFRMSVRGLQFLSYLACPLQGESHKYSSGSMLD